MNLLTILLALAPKILDVVRTVETAMPASPGREKLGRALDVVDTIVRQVPAAAAHAEAVRENVRPMIETAVSVLNATGVFKRRGR